MTTNNEILIENYKGIDIFYKVYLDEFTCEIAVGEKIADRSRTSLEKLREAIDEYFKKNSKFEPVQIYFGIPSDCNDGEIATITGIRKDSGVQMKRASGKSEKMSDYAFKNCYNVTDENTALINEITLLNRQIKTLRGQAHELAGKVTRFDVKALIEKYK